MGPAESEAFLTYLAVDRHSAASTQNQALSALLFLYKEVLRQEVGSVDAVRARKPTRLPTVLTKAEALQVRHAMVGVPQVMAKLLYGSGVRGLECGACGSKRWMLPSISSSCGMARAKKIGSPWCRRPWWPRDRSTWNG